MGKNIITISREFGSGGHTIGKMVAEQLGIEIYDKDVIRKTVEESGLHEKFVKAYGGYAPTADDRFAYGFVDLDSMEDSPVLQLWKTREKIIKGFARTGPCVIVGSCADYILRERDDVLKVFLYADDRTKRERIKEIYGYSDLKTRNKINNIDVRRGIHYKYFTGREWGKAQYYDLALNRGSLGIDKCVELIVAAAK